MLNRITYHVCSNQAKGLPGIGGEGGVVKPVESMFKSDMFMSEKMVCSQLPRKGFVKALLVHCSLISQTCLCNVTHIYVRFSNTKTSLHARGSWMNS